MVAAAVRSGASMTLRSIRYPSYCMDSSSRARATLFSTSTFNATRTTLLFITFKDEVRAGESVPVVAFFREWLRARIEAESLVGRCAVLLIQTARSTRRERVPCLRLSSMIASVDWRKRYTEEFRSSRLKRCLTV